MAKKNLRKAFSMITAIFVIVIMATIAGFVMNLSGKIVKATTAQYQHEQAELYAKSYTEYAVLAVTGHSRTVNCVETINGTIGDINQGGYAMQVRIAYIGLASEISNCLPVRQLSTAVTTTTTPMTIVIDAYVKYKDPDNTAQKITVHRRTIEKI